jgi:uncharacterized protein (TIGR02680 family)
VRSPYRFRPSRYGIVSLYQYSEQVFVAEHGRLALRGRNTSGKSKALELLVPFVLDGDITPRKLDPFASRTKTMRWNLIECTDDYSKDSKRIGYVWAEFLRIDEEESSHVITCGVGLEAVRGSDGVKDRWYFVTPQRVGTDIQLCRDVRNEREPLVKAHLTEIVRAGGGEVFEKQADYKEAIRAALLPFPSPALYEQHLEVVRQLRKPKLSDKLDSDGLARLLSTTLPVVNEVLMRRLGDSLERLQGMQAEAEALAQAREMVAGLAAGEHRAYARGVVFTRAEALKAAEGTFERARTATRTARESLADAEGARDDAHNRSKALRAESIECQAERETLMASEEYKAVAALNDRRRERDEASTRLDSRRRSAEQLTVRLFSAQRVADEAQKRTDGALDELRGVALRLSEAVVRAGLELGDIDADELRRLEDALQVRQAQIEEAERLHRELRRAQDAADVLRTPLEEAQKAVEDAQSRHEEADLELEIARQSAEHALEAWAEDLVELALADADVEELRKLLAVGQDARARAGELGRTRLEAILSEIAALHAHRERLTTELEAVIKRLRALRTQGDPAPDPRSPRPPVRDARVGAPLWLVCDFADDLPQDQHGPLEAALEEAGLLDAWISPDGALHDGDTVLIPETVTGPSLATLLCPAVGASGMDPARVESVLRSVALDGHLSVSPGRFQLGPLHGRHAKERAEFIGAAAREQRRQVQIARAEAEQTELERQLTALNGQTDQLHAAMRRLQDEQRSVPSAAAVHAALQTVASLADQVANAERVRAGLLARRDRADEAVSNARDNVFEHARRFTLPAEGKALESIEQALKVAGREVGEARVALERREYCLTALGSAETVRDERKAEVEEADSLEQDALGEFKAAEGRLTATEQAQGATAEQVQTRLDALRTRLAEIDTAKGKADREYTEACVAVSSAEHAVSIADAGVEQADDARARALQDVRILGVHDLFSAGLGDEHAPVDERRSDTWTLTTALERVRALPDTSERIDLAHRRRRVEESVSELARKLVSFDMDAALRSDGDLTIVQMTWHGVSKTLPAMVHELDDDLARREQIMSEERRRVFGDALLSEIAEHLRSRVTDVRISTRQRNETLRRCTTGAGRWVQLKWQKALESPAERDVLALLEGPSVEMLGDADRRRLFEFFEARIDQARGDLLDLGTDKSAADYLAQAFDYRTWWRFDLMLHEPNRDPRRLTATTQAKGSGGEQSVLMHMPLFATAASTYDMVPDAPRIIALDEAMDGIDEPTREQMFAVLVELDLDLFITSFDINPCVATVPRIGFYELHRDQAEWGVFGQHFIWDGVETIEVDD